LDRAFVSRSERRVRRRQGGWTRRRKIATPAVIVQPLHVLGVRGCQSLAGSGLIAAWRRWGPAICETLRPHLSVDLRFGLLPLFGRAATGDGIPGTTIAACPSCHSFGVRGRQGHTISGRVFNVSEVLRRHSRMTRFAVRSSRARDVGDPNALGSKGRRSAIPRPTYRQARRESLATDRSRAAARGTASAEPDARPSRLRAAATKEQI
jgi:hypothetical protein